MCTKCPLSPDDRKEPEEFIRKMNELATDDTIKDIADATSDTTFERAAKEQVKLYRWGGVGRRGGVGQGEEG